jgi:hypothetical protein
MPRDSAGNWAKTVKDSCDTAKTFMDPTDQIAPDNDMTLGARPGPNQSVILTWNPGAIDSADKYRTGIWYKTTDYPDSANDPTATLLDIYNLTVSVDTADGLKPGQTYWFTLTARDTSGNWADTVNIACSTAMPIDTLPPDNDVGLTATALSSYKIRLTWNPAAVDSTDKYRAAIWYKAGDFPDSAHDVTTVAADSYNLTVTCDTVEGLSPNTKYYFSLLVRDTTGNWADTQQVACASATTPMLETPTNDVYLTATALSRSSIRLAWAPGTPDPVNKADVGIWYKPGDFPDSAYDATATLFKIKAITADSVDTVQGLSPDLLYYFSLVVRTAAGNWSDTAWVATDSARCFAANTAGSALINDFAHQTVGAAPAGWTNPNTAKGAISIFSATSYRGWGQRSAWVQRTGSGGTSPGMYQTFTSIDTGIAVIEWDQRRGETNLDVDVVIQNTAGTNAIQLCFAATGQIQNNSGGLTNIGQTYSAAPTRGAQVSTITINRTGSALDAEVPRALVYLDANQDDVIDNKQAPLAQAVFVSGQAQIVNLGGLSLSATANWLLAYPVAADANELHTAGGTILSTGITGTTWTTITFGGITSGDHTLPVKLASLRALYAAGVVSLLWRTETDNLKWRVWRKPEGGDQYTLLTEIVKKKAEQTTAFPTDYHFDDGAVVPGMVYYYLLEDVALDGTITRHGPVRVSTLAEWREAPGWRVLSQPVRTVLRITSAELATHVDLTVYDLAGLSHQHAATDNTNFITVDIRALPTGIYTFELRVRGPDGSETQNAGRLLKVE